ncbi:MULTISPECIES: hypothetical protein [Streptomyces]|uniref:Lipoprotein n=2 Tax=Streptomyces TaxID=1883 RepID=A0A2N8P4X9_STRNR|nr:MULTISPECIES: hypothetical protein [Streptomyces]PNE36064.1 hypothetical protein AOB60_38595 [Streptomyces noursei]SHN15507.1 hypothetical protein SAMN05216268_121161 [Streptomyces yunnanensis]
MVVQDRRGGTVAAAVACGTGLMAGLLATAGCSPDGAAADDQVVPGQVAAAVQLRRSAEALVRAGTAKLRTAMETVSGGTRVAIRGAGGYDFASASGQLRVVLPDLKGKPSGGHQPITEILAPGALFMKNRGAGVPADKWVRVDTATLSDGNLVTGGVTDPLAAAELLRGAREVTYQGEERLGGVLVRHYRGTTDLAVAAGAASARSKPALVAAEKGFTTVVVPFDAYVDTAGRLRKLRQRFRFANGVPQGAAVVSTTELYGFGTKVAVRLPDRRDIYTGKIASAPS